MIRLTAEKIQTTTRVLLTRDTRRGSSQTGWFVPDKGTLGTDKTRFDIFDRDPTRRRHIAFSTEHSSKLGIL